MFLQQVLIKLWEVFYLDTKENFLNEVCNEIKYKPARKGIAEELELHIEDIKEEYINMGLGIQEAEEKAVQQMGGAKVIGKKLNKIHKPKLDWKLLILVLILMGFGLVVAFFKSQAPFSSNYIRNTIIYMIIGIILSIGIYYFDYRKIKKYSNMLWIIATLIMLLPNGPLLNYTRYVRIFNITFFPPVVAMPLYIISFIGNIVNYDKSNIYKISILNKQIEINKNFFKIIVFTIISLLLMVSIPSIENAFILGIAYLIITTIKIAQNKEDRIKKLATLYGIVTLFLGIVIFTLIMSPFRLQRITSSFNPEADPEGSGYTGMLQKEILENAKLIGEAETVIMTNEENIINSESTFTFIYLIGKAGLVVAGILVFVIILTSIKLIINSKIVKEEYGRMLIIGLSILFILQSLAAMLMNVNLGIQVNINLPFVTYGGVYLIVNLLSLALILSIYRRKDINECEKEKKENSLKKIFITNF